MSYTDSGDLGGGMDWQSILQALSLGMMGAPSFQQGFANAAPLLLQAQKQNQYKQALAQAFQPPPAVQQGTAPQGTSVTATTGGAQGPLYGSMPQSLMPLLASLPPDQGAPLLLSTAMKNQNRQSQMRALQELFAGQTASAVPADQQTAPVSTPPSGNQPLGIRNNNPGNLKPNGQFAQYPDMQTGIAAADQLLAQYGRQGVNTVQKIVSKWAPPAENDTAAYISDVSAKTGFAPQQPLNLADPNIRRNVLNAIVSHENGNQYSLASLPASGSPAQGQTAQAAQAQPGLMQTALGLMAGDDSMTLLQALQEAKAFQQPYGAPPAGYAYGKNGVLTFIPGGPADPSVMQADEKAKAMGQVDDTQVENMAHMIATYQLAPLSGFALRTPMGMAVMARVQDINPQYRAQLFNASNKAQMSFASGPQGNAVRSFNVAIAHLGTLDRLSDALQNSNTQAYNQVANAFKAQFGQTAPTNFDAAKAIVGDEIIKAIIGSGGALADRENAQNQLNSAKSWDQLRQITQTYRELMAGQLRGLQKQYEQTTMLHNFNDFLLPDTQQELEKTQYGSASQKPPAGQQTLDSLLRKYGIQ